MRDIGDEVGLERLGRAELAHHEVKIVVNVADIAKEAPCFHLDLKVAACDLLHRARQARDGGKKRNGKARRRSAAEQQREDEQPDEGRHVDAQVLKAPGRKRSQQRHADKARHADKEELHADIEPFIPALAHAFTTL